MTAPDLTRLAYALEDIEVNDTDYEQRYPLVFHALSLALFCGYAAGVRVDPTEPEWPVIYIELPTGQVSWHVPAHPTGYDGHTSPQKYERIHAFVAQTVVTE